MIKSFSSQKRKTDISSNKLIVKNLTAENFDVKSDGFENPSRREK